MHIAERLMTVGVFVSSTGVNLVLSVYCSKVNVAWICITLSRTNIAYKALIHDKCLTRVHTVLPATKHQPLFHAGMARLSGPEWLVRPR